MQRLLEFIGNHYLIVGVFMVLLALFVRNEVKRGGKTVTTQELVNLVNQQGAVVLDVRDNTEFSNGHIVDSINIPFGSLNSRLSELEKYKDKAIVVACKVGQHAGQAGSLLKKAGFENVARLRGGVTEWRNQNMPVVKR